MSGACLFGSDGLAMARAEDVIPFLAMASS
jgi:hypothetical protein